jgi:hypothetical protein
MGDKYHRVYLSPSLYHKNVNSSVVVTHNYTYFVINFIGTKISICRYPSAESDVGEPITCHKWGRSACSSRSKD